MSTDLRVFVFSYNRGRYLRNCLESLFRHAPDLPVTVIDDGSEDPAVAETLSACADRVEAVVRDSRDGLYLGGLYRNMQYVVDARTDAGLGLFIQDDMQLVRDLQAADRALWRRYFERYGEAIEMYGCFFKRKQVGTDPEAVTRLVQIDETVPVYFRRSEAARRAHFSAVGVFHLERMRRLGWRFEPSEGENNRRNREEARPMGMTPYPFMMWLPNAESAKFRRKGLMHRFAEWKAGVGFYPYEPMPAATVDRLMEHDLRQLPVAEHLLQPRGMDTRRPWLFADATKAIKPLHRWMKRHKKRQVAEQRRRGS